MTIRKIYTALLFFNIALVQTSLLFASEENKKGFFGRWAKNPFSSSKDNNVYEAQGEIVGKIIPIAAQATQLLEIDKDQRIISDQLYSKRCTISLKILNKHGVIERINTVAFITINPLLINQEEVHEFAFHQGVEFCADEIHRYTKRILDEDKRVYDAEKQQMRITHQSEKTRKRNKGLLIGAATAGIAVGVVAYFYSKKS